MKKQQASQFAAVDGALAPVIVKAFVVIGMHVCEEESCSVWSCPVIYGDCHTSTLQDVAVRHDLTQSGRIFPVELDCVLRQRKAWTRKLHRSTHSRHSTRVSRSV